MPKLCYLCDKPVLGDVPYNQDPISKKLAHVACLPEYILRPALVVINRLSSRPRRLVMFGAIGAVFLFERLAPFTFSGSPGEFDLWPFLGWMDAGMPVDSRGLLAFLFFCCALIWLLREAAIPMDYAVAAVVGGVLAIELLQMWQPHQSASITDPLLALGAGLVLRLIDPAARGRRFSYR